jgi:hypothetical protein
MALRNSFNKRQIRPNNTIVGQECKTILDEESGKAKPACFKGYEAIQQAKA